MASHGGTGLSAMVSGKSAHKQFMIGQSKSNYVKRVFSAKPTIDNGLPKTFRNRLQKDGRIAINGPPMRSSRPSSSTGRQKELTTTRMLSTSAAFDPEQGETSGGDLLDTHCNKFTNSKPFTPRVNKGKGVPVQSRLVASGVYVRPPAKQRTAASAGGAGSGRGGQRRRFDGTYDLYDGGLADREKLVQQQHQMAYQTPPPIQSQQQRRTAGWILDGRGTDNGDIGQQEGSSSNAYNMLFSKIDEAYYPFAEAIIKDITSSGVSSNRMIRIIMQKHVELNRNRLKSRQMDQVCQLIAEYLDINDEDDDEDEYTSKPAAAAGYGSASLHQQHRQVDQRHEEVQLQPRQPRQHPPPQPMLAVGYDDAEDEQPTLTEVSQMDATQTPTPLPRELSDNTANDVVEDPAAGSRSATPLEDFHDALQTQIHDVAEFNDEDEAKDADRISDAYRQAYAGAGAAANNNNDDARSMSEFGATLRPGQFEAMQTTMGSPSKGKTVRFSS